VVNEDLSAGSFASSLKFLEDINEVSQTKQAAKRGRESWIKFKKVLFVY